MIRQGGEQGKKRGESGILVARAGFVLSTVVSEEDEVVDGLGFGIIEAETFVGDGDGDNGVERSGWRWRWRWPGVAVVISSKSC